MVQWIPRRRFEVVAADVLTVSPTSRAGNKKVLVVADLFTRYAVAVALPDESAATLARALLERWFLVFGPPERLLTDRGAAFTGRILADVASTLGVKQIWTSAYHPQCDGMVERFNRSLTRALRALVVIEDRWDEALSLALWQYNTSPHSVTQIAPYRALFGSVPWDFCANLTFTFDSEELESVSDAEVLAEELRDLHASIFDRTARARSDSARQYDKAVNETVYRAGDRVLVWLPAAAVDTGRKLHTPWVGPVLLSEVAGVVARGSSEVTGSEVRAHVNRLKRVPAGIVETAGPAHGLYPDTRRLISAIVASMPDPDHPGGRRYKIRAVGRAGHKWTSDLPDIVKRAYDRAHESRSDRH
jgi:hypothetical protein